MHILNILGLASIGLTNFASAQPRLNVSPQFASETLAHYILSHSPKSTEIRPAIQFLETIGIRADRLVAPVGECLRSLIPRGVWGRSESALAQDLARLPDTALSYVYNKIFVQGQLATVDLKEFLIADALGRPFKNKNTVEVDTSVLVKNITDTQLGNQTVLLQTYLYRLPITSAAKVLIHRFEPYRKSGDQPTLGYRYAFTLVYPDGHHTDVEGVRLGLERGAYPQEDFALLISTASEFYSVPPTSEIIDRMLGDFYSALDIGIREMKNRGSQEIVEAFADAQSLVGKARVNTLMTAFGSWFDPYFQATMVLAPFLVKKENLSDMARFQPLFSPRSSKNTALFFRQVDELYLKITGDLQSAFFGKYYEVDDSNTTWPTFGFGYGFSLSDRLEVHLEYLKLPVGGGTPR